MTDRPRIYAGLVAGLLGLSFPVWYALATGRPGEMPALEMPAGGVRCVEDAAYMRAHHPRLLRQWRDEVVRDGLDSYVSPQEGRKCRMSLTRTCLACHGDHRAFCDRCHDYARVGPKLDCWDCHVDPAAKIQTTPQIAPHQP